MPNVLDFNRQLKHYRFAYSPSCPYCGKTIFPEVITAVDNDNRGRLFLTMYCPGCNDIYFEEFELRQETSNINSIKQLLPYYQSVNVYPSVPMNLEFTESISQNYIDFVDIYTQAAIAESMKLDKICGMGYRKALESLTKQYAQKKFPDALEQINSETLSQTINRFESQKIKTLAKAATWLGNDQTHMIAKHPEYDINQLKAFIKFLCQEIEAEEEFQKAQELIAGNR